MSDKRKASQEEDRALAAAKRRKKKNRPWIVALIIEIVALILICVFMVKNYFNSRYSQVDYVDLEDTHVNKDIDDNTMETMSGYTTIALFGIDTRDSGMVDEGSRSDCIIICSINNDTQEIKMVSVYRDTYLELCNSRSSYEKCTHAYAYDGPQGAVDMLNKNLDLNITEFVSVNFTALTEAIDALGGLDIELKSSELNKLNECIEEQMRVNGIQSDYVYNTGVVHLNGVQATAYARIRSTDQGDITRTWRQRTVISKMIETAKSQGLSQLLNCVDVVVDDISTSLTQSELTSLITNCFNYELGTTTGFPFTYSATSISGASVIVASDLATNVTMLHRFLYDDNDYTPSSTVQSISNNIVNTSGVTNELDLNTYVIEDDEESICD